MAEPKKPVDPKVAAFTALLLAILGVAVLFYPPLKPVCQSLGGCQDPVEAPVGQ